MQKIKGLKQAPKAILITDAQERFIQKEMKRLGIKFLSEYIRHLIDKEKKSA